MVAFYAPLITILVGLADIPMAQAGMPLITNNLTAASRFAVEAGFIVTGVAAAGFVFKPIRRDVAAFVPIDVESPVHALALALVVVYFGTQVTYIAFTDVLAGDLAQPPLTILDLFLNETPFLILALAGVGLFIRRDIGQAAARLGVVRPAWWHLALALAAAGGFFALAAGSDALNHVWSPQVAHRVDVTTQHLFGQLGGDFGAGTLALALLPGICEEILFRGALQPRIGLLATALLFASIHTQYGLSVDTAAIFTIALGLGLIRKYTNTTTSCLCHVCYNLLVGVNITSALLGAGIVIELALAAVAFAGFWTNRRRPAPAAGP
jgi:hypothetical protein